MKSIKDLQGNIIDSRIVENFEFIEGSFSFIELKELLGKRNFGEFLYNYLIENNVKLELSVKNGIETIRPLRLTNGKLLKFWVDSEGVIQDVSIFEPKTLF